MVKAMACVFVVNTLVVHSLIPHHPLWIPVHVIAAFFITRWLIKHNAFPTWLHRTSHQ